MLGQVEHQAVRAGHLVNETSQLTGLRHPAVYPSAWILQARLPLIRKKQGAITPEMQIIASLESLRIAILQHRHSRPEEHTSELQSLMRTSYAVICLKKK